MRNIRRDTAFLLHTPIRFSFILRAFVKKIKTNVVHTSFLVYYYSENGRLDNVVCYETG